MKRCVIPSILLLMLATACSDGEGGPSAPADDSGVRFVAPDGDDLAMGGRDDPYARISFALAAAAAQGATEIRVAAGDYTDDLDLADGIHLVGGLDPDGWVESAAPSRVQLASRPVSALGIAAETDVLNFEFVAPPTNAMNSSSTALVLEDCGAGLRFESCSFRAGDGLAGADGVIGSAGQRGGDGGDGVDAFIVSCPGGVGGGGPCPGGAGGSASGGYQTWEHGEDGACAGGAGGTGNGGGNPAADGDPGDDGLPGADGQPMSVRGVFAAEPPRLFLPLHPAAGEDGGHGSGGGGGGAVLAGQEAASGGGGGSGGEGGRGGGSGHSGGHSIAVVSIASTARFVACVLSAGNAGAAGDGAPGGAGGLGGSGGEGVAWWGSGAGGQGGDGERGGDGAGGNGALSCALLLAGAGGPSFAEACILNHGAPTGPGSGAGAAGNGLYGVAAESLRVDPPPVRDNR